MKKTYETLDDYLEDLDKIKEGIALETKGMDAKQVRAYFEKARQELERLTGRKVRTRTRRRKVRATS